MFSPEEETFRGGRTILQDMACAAGRQRIDGHSSQSPAAYLPQRQEGAYTCREGGTEDYEGR